MKFKDYYDAAYAKLMADKISQAYPGFKSTEFIDYIATSIGGKEFLARQDVIVDAFELYLSPDYKHNLDLFTQILGPELAQPAGMFSEGWWLWPVGRYVERHGHRDFEASMAFIYALTRRFTGEFAIRPLIEKYPVQALAIIESWSRDENVHVRRLASEGLRLRLPWAKKMNVVLDHFDEYVRILSNLKDDPAKFVQKSVGNNLNDLYKDHPEKVMQIISLWQQDNPGKATQWIIKHGLRSQKKDTPQQ